MKFMRQLKLLSKGVGSYWNVPQWWFYVYSSDLLCSSSDSPAPGTQKETQPDPPCAPLLWLRPYFRALLTPDCVFQEGPRGRQSKEGDCEQDMTHLLNWSTASCLCRRLQVCEWLIWELLVCGVWCVSVGVGGYLRLRPVEHILEIWSPANLTHRVPISHTWNSNPMDQLVLCVRACVCVRLTTQLEVKKEFNFTEELH